MLEHGIENGVIKRLPHGEYIEVHQPLGPVDAHGHPIPLEYQGAAVPKKMNKLCWAGKPGAGSFLRADPPAQAAEQTSYDKEQHHKQLEILAAYQDQIAGGGDEGEHGH